MGNFKEGLHHQPPPPGPGKEDGDARGMRPRREPAPRASEPSPGAPESGAASVTATNTVRETASATGRLAQGSRGRAAAQQLPLRSAEGSLC